MRTISSSSQHPQQASLACQMTPTNANSPRTTTTSSLAKTTVLIMDADDGERQPKRRISAYSSSSALASLLITLAFLGVLSSSTTTYAAAHNNNNNNPVQVGFRLAVSNSPFLSKIAATRRPTRQQHQQHHSSSFSLQQRRTLFATNNENEAEEADDDSLVQSAFWHASSPTEILESRCIEYPVSRTQPKRAPNNVARPTDDANKHAAVAPKEEESELEFLESQMDLRDDNLFLAGSIPTQKKHTARTAPVNSNRHNPNPNIEKKQSMDDNKKEHDNLQHSQSQHLHHEKESGGRAAPVRGGVTASRPLLFWETMICGAISRSVAQTIMHPANTMKTMLQSNRGPSTSATLVTELLKPSQFRRLTYGAGANLILSIPTGALNFAVLEVVRHRMGELVRNNPFLAERQEQLGAGLDFFSSALSTIACSVVATPQMMIVDNIMAGNYPNLVKAMQGLYAQRGPLAFYRGWWPGLVGKIPSYALTWTLFQQLKQARNKISDRPARNYENSIMGCLASGTTVCIMIPMDTIKTRLVTQGGIMAGSNVVPYKGIIDCALRVAKEEGIGAFYRGLPPRLVSVVPMIGIQFGVYEAMKKAMLRRQVATPKVALSNKNKPKLTIPRKKKIEPVVDEDEYTTEQVFENAAMEVASSGGNPIPVPHIHHESSKVDPKKADKKKKPKIPIKNKQ